MKKANNNGNFELRAQSVVQVIISGLMIWVGFSVVNMGKSIVRLEEKAVAQATKTDERAVQTARDIAEMKASATAVAANAVSTATALAATVATTAAALAAVATQQQQQRQTKP